MKLRFFSFLGLFICFGFFAACQTPKVVKDSFTPKPYFTSPPPEIPLAGKELFYRALHHQEDGENREAINAWKDFLAKHPRAYEGHNNLGLVYYSDDQVENAIKSLDTAHSLEPSERTIKKNLIEALKFKARLLKDSKDYHAVIANLRRIGKLSNYEERRITELRIEAFQDKIFQETRRADTIAAYRDFIRLHPDSLKNVEAAKLRIQQLKGQEPRAKFPDLKVDDKGEEGGSFPETIEEETLIKEETITFP